MIFDIDDAVSVELISYEGMFFESREDLVKYIDSCECDYFTENFLLDREDHLKYNSYSELRGDMSDDELEALFDEFEHNVDALLMQYDISYSKRERDTYRLSGTFANMKAFAKEYDSHLDFGNPGEALYDVEEAADIDIDSGDDDLIAFRYDN